MKNKFTALLITVLLSIPLQGTACSMYKITKNGKTVVGNNEDYLSPNSQFWYENPSDKQFGVMYMGQLDNFAQGAINDKGLVFDGFYVPYLPINNAEGKIKIPIGKVMKKIMQTMSDVTQVKTYLETIDLSSLTSSMVVFVDQSGAYLIVEGDEMIIGADLEKSFSNFYYSQTETLNQVNLDYFQNGQQFLNASKGKPTLDYCSEAMGHFAQKESISPTQYSTIYDLNALTVRVYLFHDYSQFVEIDLKTEFSKGNHRTMIADLFPKKSLGYQHYLKYNNPEQPTLFIEEIIGTQKFSEAQLEAMDFANDINKIGYEWLKDKQNPTAAIRVFEYAISLMPNNYDLYDSLGEAYLEKRDWNNAIKNYEKSLALNPENENATEKILRCKTEAESLKN